MKTWITSLLVLMIIPTLNAQEKTTFSYESKNAFNETTVYKHQKATGITTHKMVIDGTESRIPFYYYQNAGDHAQHIILLLHGLGGSKEDFISGGYEYQKKLISLKDTLLTLGYSLAIPDARYHGERSYELDFRPAFTLVPMPGKTAEDGWIFEKCNANSIADYLHLMDFFESRQPRARFSVIGYSMGGNASLILNGIDKRLDKVIACVPPLNRPAADTTGTGWPTQLNTALNNVTPMLYGKSQTAPVLMLLGNQDPYYTKEEIEQFADMSLDGTVSYQYLNGGHDLPREYIEKAVTWLIDK